MSKPTVQTVKTDFVTTNDGIRFAYRRLGPSTGIPLLFLTHFRGTIDHWDPLLVHPIAEHRPVILFDNAGIGHSTGQTDNSMVKMAAHVIDFLALLEIKEVDILGFSMGGLVAPLVELNGPPGLVRKLIITGASSTAGPRVIPSLHQDVVSKNAGAPLLELENLLILFFKPTEASQAAGRAWWARIHERTKESSGEERVGFVSDGMIDGGAGLMALGEAFARAGNVAYADEGSYDRLDQIKIPVLVANGYEDIMIPTINSFHLSQMLPNAFLLVYPGAGHGFMFQFPEHFVKTVGEFLDGW